MLTLTDLLSASAEKHHHLCPRQVLGVRMGLLAGRRLGLSLPQSDKRLVTLVETDGCVVSGLSVATGCWVGRRTLRVIDFGKVAATFIDTHTEQAVRIAPQATSRQSAKEYAPADVSRWESYLIGYQLVPDEKLFEVQVVRLRFSLAKLLSKEGYRVNCEACGEEIFNQREVQHEGSILCRACAGEAYYHLPEASVLPIDTGSWP